MRTFLIVAAVLCLGVLTVASISGCKGLHVLVGSGKTVSQDYNFTDFSKISAGWNFSVEVSKGTSFGIKVTVDDNLQSYLDVSRDGDTLKLDMNNGYTYAEAHLSAVVTMPRLDALTLSGASKAAASGFDSGTDFILNVSGASQATLTGLKAGKLTMDISGASRAGGDIDAAGDATLQASGASNINITGKAVNADVESSGASTVNLTGFAVTDARADISGASNATINATGVISGDVSGASRLYYTGDPTLGTIHTSGASSISKK